MLFDILAIYLIVFVVLVESWKRGVGIRQGIDNVSLNLEKLKG